MDWRTDDYAAMQRRLPDNAVGFTRAAFLDFVGCWIQDSQDFQDSQDGENGAQRVSEEQIHHTRETGGFCQEAGGFQLDRAGGSRETSRW
jgi:hypothetical protein